MTLKRVVIIHPYGLGDLLFVTPILRALRSLPTIECVDLVLGSRTKPLMSANPHVDDIFVVDKDHLRSLGRAQAFGEVWKLGKILRGKKYDLMLDFSLRGEYGFFGRFFLGIPKRAGFDYKRRGFWHTHRLKIPEGFSNRHVVEYFCDLAQMAGIPVPNRFLEVYIPEEAEEEARRRLKDAGVGPKEYIVMGLGGGESWGKEAYFKRWRPEYFFRLAEKIEKDLAFKKIFLVGSASESQLGKVFETGLKGEVINLCGQISIMASGALIKQSAVFIGNDGGLVHVAHALRTPVIGFYGPVNPSEYGPYPGGRDAAVIFKEGLPCRPCYKRFRFNSACQTRECLEDLSPEEVYRMLQKSEWLKNRQER